MIKVFRASLLLPFLFVFAPLRSQETLLKVPFSQPGKLLMDAGDDQVLEAGQTLILGTDIDISGGSPEFTYRWNDNQGNEFFTPSISVTEAGTYSLTVTDGEHCTANDSVIVARFSSIENIESGSVLSVFPNPSSGIFYCHIIKLEDEDVLEVISAEGRVVFKKELQPAQGGITALIDLTGLGKGQYVVKLHRKGSSQVISIIIQ